MERDILTVEEAADYLRIKKSTLQQKVRKGEIPFTQLGEKTVVFVKRFLDVWLATVTRGSGAPALLALVLSQYAHPILPGNLLPLSKDVKEQLLKSDADIAAGRVTKWAD